MHSFTRIPSVIATASFFIGAFSRPHEDKTSIGTSLSQTKSARDSTACNEIQYSFSSGENGPGTTSYDRSEAVKVSFLTVLTNMAMVVKQNFVAILCRLMESICRQCIR